MPLYVFVVCNCRAISQRLLPAAEHAARLAVGLLGAREDGLLVALTIDLALDVLSGLPASLLGHLNIAHAAGGGLLGLARVAAADVALDEERDEEVGERGEVDNVEPNGESLAGGSDAGHCAALIGALDIVDHNSGSSRAVGGGGSRRGGGAGLGAGKDGKIVADEGVQHGGGATDQELSDLHRRQGALDEHGHPDVEGSHGVVGVLVFKLVFKVISLKYSGGTHHDGVDERVEEDKDPDGHRHVADTSPHAHHGAGMVVGLESRAEFALGENDESVEDLVELAEVEEPAVEGKTLIPHAPSDEAARKALLVQPLSRIGLPRVDLLIEEGGVAHATRSVNHADGVDGAGNALGPKGADQSAAHGVEHPPPSPC